MKIPIKKTNNKVPVSRHITLIMENTYNIPFDLHPTRKLLLVKDIYTGKENPLYVGSDFMEAIRNPKITSTYPERVPGTKPSLLTRVKERFKR